MSQPCDIIPDLLHVTSARDQIPTRTNRKLSEEYLPRIHSPRSHSRHPMQRVQHDNDVERIPIPDLYIDNGGISDINNNINIPINNSSNNVINSHQRLNSQRHSNSVYLNRIDIPSPNVIIPELPDIVQPPVTTMGYPSAASNYSRQESAHAVNDVMIDMLDLFFYQTNSVNSQDPQPCQASIRLDHGSDMPSNLNQHPAIAEATASGIPVPYGLLENDSSLTETAEDCTGMSRAVTGPDEIDCTEMSRDPSETVEYCPETGQAMPAGQRAEMEADLGLGAEFVFDLEADLGLAEEFVFDLEADALDVDLVDPDIANNIVMTLRNIGDGLERRRAGQVRTRALCLSLSNIIHVMAYDKRHLMFSN